MRYSINCEAKLIGDQSGARTMAGAVLEAEDEEAARMEFYKACRYMGLFPIGHAMPHPCDANNEQGAK